MHCSSLSLAKLTKRVHETTNPTSPANEGFRWKELDNYRTIDLLRCINNIPAMFFVCFCWFFPTILFVINNQNSGVCRSQPVKNHGFSHQNHGRYEKTVKRVPRFWIRVRPLSATKSSPKTPASCCVSFAHVRNPQKTPKNLSRYGCFHKWCYPTTMGFPTKKDHFGVFWGYPYFWKHPYPLVN